jgi:RNA polymerase-binding transcription factor DksA
MAKAFSQEFINLQKKRLEEDLKDLLAKIEELKRKDPFLDPDHATDNAAVDTDVREQLGHDTVEAQIKDLSIRAEDIKAALIRINKGRYGICQKCGKAIPQARLKIIPESAYCIDCEKKLRA